MSYTFLLGPGEASSADSFLAMSACAPSSWKSTLGVCYSSDSGTDCCHGSPCGTMCGPSTEDHGADTLTSCAAGSPARTAHQEAQQELESTESEAGCGLNLRGSFAKLSQTGCLWKTHQTSFIEGLDEFCQTWPSWGLMRDGECWERITLDFPMSATVSGLLPTPTKSWGRRGPGLSNNMNNLRMSLKSTKASLSIVKACGWRWPASFLEWMMGWPISWTELKPLETDKYQQWLHSHGACLAENDGSNQQEKLVSSEDA